MAEVSRQAEIPPELLPISFPPPPVSSKPETSSGRSGLLKKRTSWDRLPLNGQIYRACAERDLQLYDLARRQNQFTEELDQHPEWFQTGRMELLQSARERLGEFPGWARLYCLLAYLETQHAHFEAAARHATLAATFDPEQPLLICVELLARAKIQPALQVLEWGREQLLRFHNNVNIRIALTYLQVVRAREPEDYREALRTLKPLTRGHPLWIAQMILLLSLCAFLAKELGQEGLYEEVAKELAILRVKLSESQLPKIMVGELEDLIAFVGKDGNPSLSDSLKEIEKGLMLAFAA